MNDQPSGPSFEEIKAAMLDRIESLVRELVPDGGKNGAYWIGRNPTRADRHGTSFWVRLRQPAIGAWRDEAGVRGVDDGDIVQLVRYVQRLPDLKATRQWCLRWLGWSNRAATPEDQAERERRRQQLAAERQRQDQEERAQRDKNARGAFGLWLKADKLDPANFPHSLLHRYLRGRAIDLEVGLLAKGKHLPGALRLFLSHDYRTSWGELLPLPCMAALMSGPDGKARAIHRTWLSPDGSGKAAFEEPRLNKARKIWPAGWHGSVIRIAKGAGNLTPEEAGKRGRRDPLVITEGIEDALAVMLALPDRRVWAAGSLGNIGNVPVLPCVASITIAADNDYGDQAQLELERAVERLRQSGRPVFVAKSPRGKDMNDLLKGEKI